MKSSRHGQTTHSPEQDPFVQDSELTYSRTLFELLVVNRSFAFEFRWNHALYAIWNKAKLTLSLMETSAGERLTWHNNRWPTFKQIPGLISNTSLKCRSVLASMRLAVLWAKALLGSKLTMNRMSLLQWEWALICLCDVFFEGAALTTTRVNVCTVSLINSSEWAKARVLIGSCCVRFLFFSNCRVDVASYWVVIQRDRLAEVTAA